MARRSNLMYILLAVAVIAFVAFYALRMKETFANPTIRPTVPCSSDSECTGAKTFGCFCANGVCGGGNDCGVKN